MRNTGLSLGQPLLLRRLPFFFPAFPRPGAAALSCLLLAGLLGGCADPGGIAPQSHLRTPQSVAQGELKPETAPLTGAWWEAWGDPQLDRLMAQALADNPTLAVARTRVAQAEAAVAGAESLTRPGVSADATLRRERFSENHVFPPPLGGSLYWNNEATIGLSYDLDLWGKQENLVAAAVDETRVARAEVWQVRQALAAAVAQSYAQWARQQALVGLAEEEGRRLEKALDLARRRQAAGLAPGRETDALVDALARQRTRIESLKTTVILARHQLMALAGLPPAADAGLTPPRLAAAEILAAPEHVPADLVGRRPDVIAQRWRVEAAGRRIDAARADFYPNIDLMAFAGYQALGFTHFLDGTSGIHGFGPALSLPIFDGGRRRSRLSQETVAYDGAVEAYNGTLVKALQSVADRLAELDANGRENAAAQESAAAARRRLVAAEKAWKAGVAAYQAVLDAQGAELGARETLAELAAARRASYAGLMLALGGGPVAGGGEVVAGADLPPAPESRP